jgi:hypothetical protein
MSEPCVPDVAIGVAALPLLLAVPLGLLPSGVLPLPLSLADFPPVVVAFDLPRVSLRSQHNL